MSAGDNLAAELDAIRLRVGNLSRGGGVLLTDVVLNDDVPRLLMALDEVLKPHQPGRYVIMGGLCSHHASHRYFSITSKEAADVQACPGCAATVYRSCAGCGSQVPAEQCPTRNAIAAALIGKAET